MTIKAIPIGEFDFTPYGTYYNLKEDAERVSHTKTDAYEDHMTKAPLIDTLGHLGYTIGGAAPCEVRSMEKHAHTEEAIFCMAEPGHPLRGAAARRRAAARGGRARSAALPRGGGRHGAGGLARRLPRARKARRLLLPREGGGAPRRLAAGERRAGRARILRGAPRCAY